MSFFVCRCRLRSFLLMPRGNVKESEKRDFFERIKLFIWIERLYRNLLNFVVEKLYIGMA